MAITKKHARLAFSQNFKEALRQSGVSDDRERRKWVAKKWGVTVESARKWLSGMAIPTAAKLFIIARDLDTDVEALTSLKSLTNPTRLIDDKSSESVTAINATNRRYKAGYVTFELLEGAVAAGEKAYMPEYPEVVQYLEVAEWWAQQNIRAPTNRVRVLTARGDSMRPDIQNGDVLFVDSGIQSYVGDGVYVIYYKNIPKVKRLQLLSDGRMAIRSNNASYETEYVDPNLLNISGLLLKAWTLRDI